MPIELSKEKKYYTSGITLSEKIEIFKKYVETFGEPPHGNVVYENYPIGSWAIQMRCKINRGDVEKGKLKLSDEQLDQIRKIGLLDPMIDSNIEEKIEFLKKWVLKYPSLEASRALPKEIIDNPDENKELIDSHKKARNYYIYIIGRKSTGKLTEKQFEECREANIGGTLGVSKKAEELSEKYGQPMPKAIYIIRKYGSSKKFIEKYRKCIKTGDGEEQELAEGFIRQAMDTNFNSESYKYDKLFMDIVGQRRFGYQIEFYSSDKLKEKIEQITPQNRIIFKKAYGLEPYDQASSYESIGKEFNLTRERIRQIVTTNVKKLRKPYNLKEIRYDTKEEEQKLLTEEDKKVRDNLFDLIFEGKLAFENSMDYPQISDEIRDGLNFVKNIDVILKNRKETFLKTLPIEEVGLSNRVTNLLMNANIKTLEDISQLTLSELLKIKDFGEKSYLEIMKKLKSCGLSLKEEVKEEPKKELKDDPEDIQEKAEIKEDENSIDNLGLSFRACNCLKRGGIGKIEDLSKFTSKEVLEIKTLGKKCFAEIVGKMKERGLKFKDEIEPSAENRSELEELKMKKERLNGVRQELIEENQEAEKLLNRYREQNRENFERTKIKE